jgi:L,D-transpeptidase YcbB
MVMETLREKKNNGRSGRLSALLVIFGLTAAATASSAFEGEAVVTKEAPVAAKTVDSPLRTLLESAMLPGLKWPRFSDHRADLERLYQIRNDKLLWTVEGKPTQQAVAAVDSLGEANDKGLLTSDYEVPLLKHWLDQLTAGLDSTSSQPELFDVTLSLSLMRYLSTLHGGRVSPYPRQPFDTVDIVERIARGGDVGRMIASVEPTSRTYTELQQALVRYRKLAVDDASYAPVAIAGVLRPGMRQTSVPDLRRLLHTVGDLPMDVSATGDPELYDSQLVAAVKRFQQRHGLAADGIVGKETMAQLGIPISRRVEQLRLGLERFRWLPNSVAGSLLLANIPSFELYAFRANGALEDPEVVMKVIVGKARKGLQTPEFHADMKYVIFGPYWNVPTSITRNEIVPILRRNPGYLARQGMEIVGSFGGKVKRYPVNAGTIARLRSGALKIRQRPGSRNALGRVKFLFPNRYSVYMHDTPAKRLFQRARRDFSHGCIRVADPARLAEFVLRDQSGWSKNRIQQAMRSSKSKRVNLRKPIPVYVFYATVLVDQQANTRFFDDIYGRDAILRRRIEKGYPYSG